MGIAKVFPIVGAKSFFVPLSCRPISFTIIARSFVGMVFLLL